MQTPCELFDRLARQRAAILAFLVSGWCDRPGHRRCRLLEESVVLDRSARLVDAFLRAVRAEAAALGDFVVRLVQDGREEGQTPGDWLHALNLLEEKVVSLVREEVADPGGALGRVAAVLATARERLCRLRDAVQDAPFPAGEAPDVDRSRTGATSR